MHISERAVDGVIVVEVSGTITFGEGGDVVLKSTMRGLMGQGHTRVLLDLREVTYVDSAGLGEIVQAYAAVSRGGGALKLLNVSSRVRDLLSITKLNTVLECHDNEADAVKSF